MKTAGQKTVQGPLDLIDQTSVAQPPDGKGYLYKKPGDLSLYWKADSYGSEVNISTAGTSAERLTASVFQAGHGFVPGNAVYLSGNTFLKAIANDEFTLADGVVSAVGDANNFTYCPAGSITLTAIEWSGVVGTSGMTIGAYYYVSSTNAGQYTTVEPGLSQKMLVARTATTAVVTNKINAVVNRNVVLVNGASGSINNIFGSELNGKYELFDKNDALLEATFFYNGNDLRVQSFDSRVTVTPNSGGCLNIYNNGNIYIQNNTGGTVDLSLYRKAI